MNNIFKTQFESVSNMTTKERNFLLCQLAVKEQMNTIMPNKIMQLEFIQAIRTANGEIATVLKNWEENPELDPRR